MSKKASAVVIALTAVFAVLGTLTVITNISNGTDSDLGGVYDIGRGMKLSLIAGEDGSFSPFFIYVDEDEGNILTETGCSESAGENLRTLYDKDGVVIGSLVYTNGTYYYMRNGMDPVEAKKTDDVPVDLAG